MVVRVIDIETTDGWWQLALAALHLEMKVGVLRCKNAHQALLSLRG
jgi:hypothetical protein